MDDGVIIGEGVLLDTRPTSFATRILASIIDLVTLGVVLVITTMLIAQTPFDLTEAGGRILGVVTIALITVIGPTIVETLTRGRSLGKLTAGIRIVRDDGGPIRFRHAFIRSLVGLGELWMTFGSVALISSLVNPQGKRLGDILAGTYALRVRGRTTVRAPLGMPAHLAAWAHHADVRRLPDGLALAVRQFLVRTSTLHPASRIELGTQLATEVGRYVAPLPPPGTHPEYFLAAVVAERRDREYAAALRSAARDSAESAQLQRLPHAVPDPAQ